MRSDMRMQDLYSEIVMQLEKLAETEPASETKLKWSRQQHKTPGYKSYGIRTPKVWKLVRSYRSRFEQLDLKEKFDLARMFYKSGFSEQATLGNIILELGVESITPVHFDFLDEVTRYFNNWATTDRFCLHVLQLLLRKYREETLKLLRKWNHSENTWKRRASVVAFVWKIGSSGDFTDEVLDLCNSLIWDEEDLVQRGVGWALRDNMHGAKKKVLDYVKSLRSKGVSSTITLYAISDLKGKEREEVLKVKPQ